MPSQLLKNIITLSKIQQQQTTTTATTTKIEIIIILTPRVVALSVINV